MEILGGGPDDDELRLERERRRRRGGAGSGADGDEDGARPRKPVAPALDLGTMDLAPESPAAYQRPPGHAPQTAPHPAPQLAPAVVPSPIPNPIATPAPNPMPAPDPMPGPAPSSMEDEWAALRRATAAGAGSDPEADGAEATTIRPVGYPPGGYLSGGRPPASARDTLDAGAGRVELNLDEEPPNETQPKHERDYRADLTTALFGSPSLALAGILVCIAGLTGGMPLLMLYTEFTGGPGESGPKIVAKGLAGIALVGAVLGVSALRRMRASTPRWVPPVAGATLLIAVVILAAAGYFWWTGTNAPPSVEDY